jgi:hypothetical protein
VLQRLKRLIYGAIWSRYRHYEDVQNIAASASVILLLWYYADYGISSEKPSLNESVDPPSSDPIGSGLDDLARCSFSIQDDPAIFHTDEVHVSNIP